MINYIKDYKNLNREGHFPLQRLLAYLINQLISARFRIQWPKSLNQNRLLAYYTARLQPSKQRYWLKDKYNSRERKDSHFRTYTIKLYEKNMITHNHTKKKYNLTPLSHIISITMYKSYKKISKEKYKIIIISNQRIISSRW